MRSAHEAEPGPGVRVARPASAQLRGLLLIHSAGPACSRAGPRLVPATRCQQKEAVGPLQRRGVLGDERDAYGDRQRRSALLQDQSSGRALFGVTFTVAAPWWTSVIR